MRCPPSKQLSEEDDIRSKKSRLKDGTESENLPQSLNPMSKAW